MYMYLVSLLSIQLVWYIPRRTLFAKFTKIRNSQKILNSQKSKWTLFFWIPAFGTSSLWHFTLNILLNNAAKQSPHGIPPSFLCIFDVCDWSGVHSFIFTHHLLLYVWLLVLQMLPRVVFFFFSLFSHKGKRISKAGGKSCRQCNLIKVLLSKQQEMPTFKTWAFPPACLC